jgi:hypothetical protein
VRAGWRSTGQRRQRWAAAAAPAPSAPGAVQRARAAQGRPPGRAPAWPTNTGRAACSHAACCARAATTSRSTTAPRMRTTCCARSLISCGREEGCQELLVSTRPGH